MMKKSSAMAACRQVVASTLMGLVGCGAALATDAKAQQVAANAFFESCYATYPTFDGIDARLQSLGFEPLKGNWRREDVQVGSPTKMSDGRKSCNALHFNADPVDMANVVFQSLASRHVVNLDASRKGRRTTITFSYKQIPTTIVVIPVSKKHASIAIFPR